MTFSKTKYRSCSINDGILSVCGPFCCGLLLIVLTSSFFVDRRNLVHARQLVGGRQQAAMAYSMIGEWTADVGRKRIKLQIMKGGNFILDDIRGTYTIDGKVLKLQSDNITTEYGIELTEKQLTLTAGDTLEPLRFSRTSKIAETRDWLTGLSVENLKNKLHRFAVIIFVVVACRLIMSALRMIIRFIIYTDCGPLKFVYRYHKNRTMTMYSLALNFSKYIIYILALGIVLNELGINYTAYLASLSVIGLAVGFGSQGLVQDMVTGFFIVFEEQFNVGDMVEIPPYIGIVQELGLRMTRLKNYLGQQVVIPNRNIATVGNYAKGAQHVNIDIAVSGREVNEKASSILLKSIKEIREQFDDIILSIPKMAEFISLSTSQHFIRLRLTIWPQQQWVIEQEVVPRIRSDLKAIGCEIPNDKIVVFDRPPEQKQVKARRNRKK